MLEIWTSVQEYIFLSLFLIVAIILKRKVGFLQRFLIPTSIIAGFIGLIWAQKCLTGYGLTVISWGISSITLWP